jgi:hypothetical protein
MRQGCWWWGVPVIFYFNNKNSTKYQLIFCHFQSQNNRDSERKKKIWKMRFQVIYVFYHNCKIREIFWWISWIPPRQKIPRNYQVKFPDNLRKPDIINRVTNSANKIRQTHACVLKIRTTLYHFLSRQSAIFRNFILKIPQNHSNKKKFNEHCITFLMILHEIPSIFARYQISVQCLISYWTGFWEAQYRHGVILLS